MRKISNYKIDVKAQINKQSLENIKAQIKAIEISVKTKELTLESKNLTNANKLASLESKKLTIANKEQELQNKKLVQANRELERESKNLTIQSKKLAVESKQLTLEQKKQRIASQEVARANKEAGQTFSDIISKVTKFGSATAIIGMFVSKVHEAWNEIEEFDRALTEFKKVSDLTGESLNNYTKNLGEIGKEISRTRKEMLESATTFKKSGFSDEESAQLAKIAELYKNIADTEITSGKASAFLISQMKSFNFTADETIKIIDAMNSIANQLPVGTNDLQIALEKSGSALGALGNSFNQSIALVEAGTSVLSSQGSKVGKGLRSIGIELSKIATKTDTLTDANGKVSVALKDENGNLKNTYEILNDLYPQWQKLNDEEKTQLAYTIAKKQQFEVLVAVLNNFSDAQKALTLAENSSGSAMKENEKVMQSLKAKVTALKTEFQDLVLGNGGLTTFAKKIVSIGVELLKFANSDIGQTIIKVGLLTAGFKLLSVAMNSSLGATVLSSIKTGLINIGTLLVAFTSGTTGASIALDALTTAFLDSPFAIATVAVVGITAIIKAIDALTVSLDEQRKIVSDLTSKTQDLTAQRNALAEKDNLTEKEKDRLDFLNAQIEANEKLLKIEQERLYKKERQPTKISGKTGEVISEGATDADNRKILEYKQVQQDIIDLEERKKQSLNGTAKELNKLADEEKKLTEREAELKLALSDVAIYLQDKIDAGVPLTEGDQKLFEDLKDLKEGWNQESQEIRNNTSELEDNVEEQKEEIDVIAQLNSELDDLQSIYSTVSKAQDEYNQYQAISLDTYQNLMAIGDQYLGLLFNEDGSLKDLKVALQDVTIARINDLAIKKAQSLIDTAVQLAEEGKSVDKLAKNYDALTQSLWGAVSAKLINSKVDRETQLALKGQIHGIQEWARQAIAGITSTNNFAGAMGGFSSSVNRATQSLRDLKQVATEDKRAIDDLLSMTIKMLKQEYADADKAFEKSIRNQIKRLKDLQEQEINSTKIHAENSRKKIENVKAEIQSQMDLLDAKRKQYEYERDLNNKTKSIATLESQITELGASDSPEDIARRLELEEQLAKEKADLEEFQFNNNVQLDKDRLQEKMNILQQEIENINKLEQIRIDSINKQYEAQINALNQELETRRENAKTDAEIRQEAIQLIQNKSDDLYERLMKWNKTYGVTKPAPLIQ